MSVNIGISTGCMYPMETEKGLDILLSEGFRRFEVFFSAPSELEGDFIDRQKHKLERCGGTVRSVHPFISALESFLLFSSYERRFFDGMKMYESFYRACARLGGSYVVMHGMRSDFHTIDDAEFFRRFSLMSATAREYGVELLLENVRNFVSSEPSLITDMKAAVPDAGFVLDTKQAVMSGHDPTEVALAMGSALRHVHISDYSDTSGCVLPGQGRLDHKKLFDTLRQIGYDGDIIIEVYRSSYGSPEELAEARSFLDKYISKEEML